MKNEILLTGNISESEIIQLNKELTDVKIIKTQIKGLSGSEFIQLVFHNFDILTFSRDFILENAINISVNQIKKVIQFFKNRNKKIESINIEIQIKTEEKDFLLDIISENCENIDLTIDLTNERLAFIIKEADTNCRMEIIFGANKSDVKINKI